MLLYRPELSTSRSSGKTAGGPLTATEIRELARRYGIRPSKTLGQNFVVDPNTIRRIVRLAEVGDSDSVVEVGAGLGTLTRELSRVSRRVLAIEFDRLLMPALEETLAGLDNVELLQADAMKIDYGHRLGNDTWRMVSNLPYNIATPLLAEMMPGAPQVKEFVVLVQREAGERLIADPGSKSYGAVSVLVSFHCERRMLGRVPASVFWPRPSVESVLIRLTRNRVKAKISTEELMTVVRAAFAQRRKTLRNSLTSTFDTGAVESALDAAGIDGSRRAEDLSLEEFMALAGGFR